MFLRCENGTVVMFFCLFVLSSYLFSLREAFTNEVI